VSASDTVLNDKFFMTSWVRDRLLAPLMNITVYLLLALWTVVGILLFPLAYLLWKLATRWPADRIMRHFIWLYGRGWMLIVAPFIRFRREGFGDSNIRPPAIFVVNHLSFFDTYCMAALPFFDIAFAVRSWPFRIFCYSAFMRLAGYLDVERMNWEENLEASRRVLDKGGFLLFFPEGHRSRDGELQHFYSGAFRLAHELGCPVVPLCLTGTDRLLPPGRRWMRPAKVHLRALPPVDPAAFEGHGELRRHVKSLMEGEIIAMRRVEN
jgi:1-acyl-sn-glycerol-3-phosphate acyltransferase